MLGTLGAHAGHVHVMEAIGARYVGMRVVAVSLVTNKGAGISATPLSHGEVSGPRTRRDHAWAGAGAVHPGAPRDAVGQARGTGGLHQGAGGARQPERLEHGPQRTQDVSEDDPRVHRGLLSCPAPAPPIARPACRPVRPHGWMDRCAL